MPTVLNGNKHCKENFKNGCNVAKVAPRGRSALPQGRDRPVAVKRACPINLYIMSDMKKKGPGAFLMVAGILQLFSPPRDVAPSA